MKAEIFDINSKNNTDKLSPFTYCQSDILTRIENYFSIKNYECKHLVTEQISDLDDCICVKSNVKSLTFVYIRISNNILQDTLDVIMQNNNSNIIRYIQITKSDLKNELNKDYIISSIIDFTKQTFKI